MAIKNNRIYWMSIQVITNKNSSLFDVNCTVDHEKCIKEDSWIKDQIVHSCPYEIIDEQGYQRYEGNK